MKALKLAREVLPGDSRYGDPLSTTGSEPRQLVPGGSARRPRRGPGILKEAGLSALQVWEAVSDADGGKLGGDRLAIVFTDLVGFSDWALEAGDDLSLELLREVAGAIEPPVTAPRRRGRQAARRRDDGRLPGSRQGGRRGVRSRERLEAVEVAGYGPRMRAGMHVGTPAGSPTTTWASTSTSPPGSPRVRRAASSWSRAMRSRSSTPSGLDARKKLMFRAKGVPTRRRGLLAEGAR